MAGTSLRGMIERFSGPVPAASKLMKELGIEVVNADGSMKSLADIVENVTAATDGMGQAQKLAAIKTLVGSRASASFLALMDVGPETMREFTEELENSGGVAEEIANKQLDNLGGSFLYLKSAIEGAAISIGDTLSPVVRAVADLLTGLVTLFNNLSDSTKSVITWIAAGVAAFLLLVGPLMILVGMIPSIVGGFSAIGLLFTKVTAAVAAAGGSFAVIKAIIATLFGPITLIIGAIAGLIAIFVYLYKTNEEFRDKVQGAWNSVVESITTALTAIWDIITQVFGQIMAIISPVIEYIKEDFAGAGSVIVDVFGGAFTFISELITTVIDYVSGVIMAGLTFVQDFLTTHGETITATLIGAYEIIKAGVMAAIEFIWFIIQAVLTTITNLWDEHGETVINFVTSAWETIQNVVETVIETVRGVIDSVTSAISEIWDKHGETIMAIVTWAFESVKDIIATALEVIQTKISGVLNIIKGIFEVVWPIISGIVQIAWGLIEMYVQTAIDIVKGIIDAAMSLIKGDWEGAWEAISGIAQDIWNNIEGFFEKIDLYEIGANIIQGLIDGIGSMVGSVVETVKGVGESMVGGIKSVLRINSPSRTFRDDIGQWIPKGLADGIDGATRDVRRSIDAMVGLMPTEIDPPRLSPVSIAPPSVSGVSGGYNGSMGGGSRYHSEGDTTINVTVEYSGGERYNRQQAEEIGRIASEHIAREKRHVLQGRG